MHAIPLAVRFMLLSALGFALMAVCVKAASQRGIPVLEIVFARALVSLLISYLDVRRKGISIWGHQRWWLLARGLVGALALICVYYSVTTLPLAEATILQYTYPAFTALLALLFLQESVQRSTVLCIALSLLGLTIMLFPGWAVAEQAALPALSVVMALLGALGSAIAYVIVRKLSQSEDSAVIIFYFPLVALPIAWLLLGDNWVLPQGVEWLYLLLVGVFTQIGQVGLTKAMALERAGKVSAYAYVQVIFSMLLGLILFAEWPTLFSVLGGALIIAGALINALYKR